MLLCMGWDESSGTQAEIVVVITEAPPTGACLSLGNEAAE